MITKGIYRGLIMLASVAIAVAPLAGQLPFLRTGQAFCLLRNVNELLEFTVQPSYNSINTITLGALPVPGLEGIGFRRTDNLLYGLSSTNNHLYRIGQNSSAQDLGTIGLNPALFYDAGDVSPNGRYYYSVGSDPGGVDVHLAITDLVMPGFPTQFVSLSGGSKMEDIAFDPVTGKLFGFDSANGCLVTVNTTSGVVSQLAPFEPGNSLGGLYFDAFGDLYGVGITLYGVVDGYYKLDKNTGKETRLATGPTSGLIDCASCPYSIELKNAVSPGINLPCTEITYTFTLANGSDTTLNGVEFLHALPAGFKFAGVDQNTFGVFVDTMSIPGSIRMQNISLTPGIRTLKVKMAVGDIPKGKYYSQAVVKNLPPLYGLKAISDYPDEPGFEDSTVFIVNRFDEDTIGFSWLICYGEILELETKDYGSNVKWNNGSTAPVRAVTTGGMYSFVAGSTCEQVVVAHEVTSASCPFTISLRLLFEPDTIYPCSEVVFRLAVSNDSGEPRYNLSIRDSLPPNFQLLEILNNPFGGVITASDPGIFRLDSIDLPVGSDTIDLLVRVGDIVPGRYANRAVLAGLPVIMGPIRLSDNPYTFPFDSSILVVKGALYDSLHLDTIVCEKSSLVLNALDFGNSFLWDDGSTVPERIIEMPGHYELTLFDGCEPATIFWDVTWGLKMQISPTGPFSIHQGETIEIAPGILNLGDSLFIQWTQYPGRSLDCRNCPTVTVTPLESTVYGLKVANEACSDSVDIVVEVDQTRRIYTGNVFSPNDDGVNDVFTLQSPDFGQVESFQIFDRWGGVVHSVQSLAIPEKGLAWDGYVGDTLAAPGVYIWMARIQFTDGRVEVFKGDVLVIR